jgi:cytochrome c5
MKRSLIRALAAGCLAAACTSTSYVPPPATPQLAARGHVNVAQLREGRTVFASRCIECHALPALTRHTASEWPRLIDEMAARANLEPAERDALVAYIVAVRKEL